MKKTKFTFTIIFVLLTGVIIGSIATYFLTKPDSEKFSFEKHHALMIKKTAKELGLGEQQEQQFYDIHEKCLSRACSILQKIKPAILHIMQDEKNEIISILTSEQQNKFKKIRAEQINRFKARFANAELLKRKSQGSKIKK